MALTKFAFGLRVIFIVTLLSGCQSAVYYGDVSKEAPTKKPTPAAPVVELGSSVPHPEQAVELPANRDALDDVTLQVQNMLNSSSWQQALDMSERGLRIDHRNGYFYQAITEAYVGLGMLDDALEFAQLGLRYCGAQSACRANLKQLIRVLQ
jgi:hypothetical protein